MSLDPKRREGLLALELGGAEVAFDAPAAERSAFAVGGPAEAWIEGADAEAEARVEAWCQRNRIPLVRFVEGRTLVREGGVKGVVLARRDPEGAAGLVLFREPRRGPKVDRLVAEAGLKGVRVRGVRLSEQDGNRVLNEGSATARDVLALLEYLRGRIARERGVKLVEELEVIGRDRPLDEARSGAP